MKSNFDDDYFIKWKVIFKPRWTSCRDSWAAQRTRRRRWIRFPSNQHCSCASSEINCIENPVDLNIKHLCFQLLRMAIHQKLVLTQRLEDIEMTDLRPANVTNNQKPKAWSFLSPSLSPSSTSLSLPSPPSPSSAPPQSSSSPTTSEWSPSRWAENFWLQQPWKQQGLLKFSGRFHHRHRHHSHHHQ